MKLAWAILMTLLLVFPPAQGSFAPEQNAVDCSGCVQCRCCIQPPANPGPPQNIPLTALVQSISVERVAPAVGSSFFTAPSLQELCAEPPASDEVSRIAPLPLFRRYCSLLI